MSNPSMEAKVKELAELRRMKEELEAEITAMACNSPYRQKRYLQLKAFITM